MADYWKSQPKKFCIYCKCWIADNKPSIDFHERGKNHKENVIKKISEIKQRSMAKVKEAEKQSKEFAAMEEAALKAYEEDLKRLEGTKPAPIAPVGPTIEERRARDEQKRKEIEAIEKHHAKKKWTKAYSSEGYPYYYNTLSGDTQWEAPDGFQDTEDKSEEQGAKPVWVEGVSEEGYTYYYNAETGESRWEKPEDFICGLPSKEDQESPTDKPEDTVAEEKADSVELKPETSSDESSQSEQATSAPSVTKTVKINFRSKKEKKTDKTPEVDSKEEDNEVKQDTKEDDSSKKQIPSQRPKKANPYGSWEEITQEEDPYDNVDLELPNMEYDEPQASVPDIPQEPKVYFKEKTITSLGDTVVGTSVFKKRKLENVKSRNIRQRLTDQ
ncbi:WW domain-binding protein 4 [Rana temporaria]|uniref:WW domain-binding protein 4 n=1 Tax=Rana temporaria TaxID=8407 RepID=UPI001AAE1374|nr:WW domain-binding protein 4 [Rana temporaria]